MPDNFEETCKPRGLGALLDEPPRFEDMLDGMSLSGSPAKTTKSNDPTRSVRAKSGMKPLSIWSDAVEPYLNQETKPGKEEVSFHRQCGHRHRQPLDK